MIEATMHTSGDWEATRYTHQDEPGLNSVKIGDGNQAIEIDLGDVPRVVGLLQQSLR